MAPSAPNLRPLSRLRASTRWHFGFDVARPDAGVHGKTFRTGHTPHYVEGLTDNGSCFTTEGGWGLPPDWTWPADFPNQRTTNQRLLTSPNPGTSRQPIRQPSRPQVGIPGQHLHGFVARDPLDFHHIQIRILKQATGRLMSQVVDMEIL